jgi:hypothetical protein
LLVVSICIYAQIPRVHSWAWGTHDSITQNAISVMPGDLSWFFTGYSSTIVTYCTLPDTWKAADSMEGYRHYDDTDVPHGEGAVLSPENYLGKEILVYQEDAIPDYEHGTLPWNLVDNFNMLVVCLEENDWDHAAQLAGVIAHYIEDASMPLHAALEYNPGGNHGAYEAKVDSEISADNVNADVPGFAPYELNNIFDSTMQELSESYGFTGNTPDKLSYWLFNSTLWNENIKTITENRLRTGTEMLANVWLTAFIQAGIYTPPHSPPPSATPTNHTPYIVGGVLVLAVISIVIVLYMRRR